jgi:hypothetical protein
LVSFSFITANQSALAGEVTEKVLESNPDAGCSSLRLRAKRSRKQLDATVPDGKTVIIIYIRYTQKPAFNDCF